MQLRSILVFPVLLGALLLSACGEKEAPPPPATPVAAPEPEPVVHEAGGYVPTAEERVPGETRPVESAPAADAVPEAAPATEAPATEAVPAEAAPAEAK